MSFTVDQRDDIRDALKNPGNMSRIIEVLAGVVERYKAQAQNEAEMEWPKDLHRRLDRVRDDVAALHESIRRCGFLADGKFLSTPNLERELSALDERASLRWSKRGPRQSDALRDLYVNFQWALWREGITLPPTGRAIGAVFGAVFEAATGDLLPVASYRTLRRHFQRGQIVYRDETRTEVKILLPNGEPFTMWWRRETIEAQYAALRGRATCGVSAEVGRNLVDLFEPFKL